jgi:hypothetical protein
MVTGKRILSITLFFIFMAIFIGALKPGDREECMVLSRAEDGMVRGGKAGYASTVSPPLDITRSNVPCHYQDISPSYIMLVSGS